MTTTSGRYDRVTRDGHQLDAWTLQALESAEHQLGHSLPITQGSWSTSVSASASTHAGAGVFDASVRNLTPEQVTRVVLVLRQNGFAAWFRAELWRNGVRVWPDHIHAVLIGNTHAAPSALRQVEAYKRGRNGLANNGPDDGPRVTWREFPYREDIEDMTPEQREKFIDDVADRTARRVLYELGVPDPTLGKTRTVRGVLTTLLREVQSIKAKVGGAR